MGWGFQKDTIHSWAYSENVFTPDECKKIINYANSQNKIDAGVLNNKNENILLENIRKNKIVWLDVNDNTSWIFDRISGVTYALNEKFFGFDLWGFAENLQFTEYKAPDQHYTAHIDKTFNDIVRKLSISVQLSDPSDYEGGDFSIINSSQEDIMKKEQGTLIAFPSYSLHKVSPVTKGTRYSLVAWTTGPKFK